MALLAAASCILFLITYFTGFAVIYLINRLFVFRLTTDFFEIFLFGLMACFIYFNLLSFFTAVNYIVLLPLIPVSFTGFVLYSRKQHFIRQVMTTGRSFFTIPSIFFTVPLLALLFVYWIIPPYNVDSGEYHYIAIRWYEKYKIVPGLGNIHGRLAFNPANFIISAAFSFTDLTKQSLYPLNGVLVLLFYAWFIKKMLKNSCTPAYRFVMLLCAILLFRNTLANISSPSSDLLAGLLLFYCGFRTYELIKERKKLFSDYVPVFLFTCFAVTAKLAAIPSVLLLPFIFFVFIEKKNIFLFSLKIGLVILLIMLPWLARNVMLSGYFFFPVPGSNLIHFDWSVPPDVLQLDYIFSRYGPRTKNADFIALQKMNIFQLTVVWVKSMYASMRVSLVIVSISFFSVLLWLILFIKRSVIFFPAFLLWCIYYICLCAWLFNSPELRFGLSYVILCMAIPLFEISRSLAIPKSNVFVPLISGCMFCCLAYYFVSAVQKGYFNHFTVADGWIKPLRDNRYLKNNNIQTFPAVMLGNGVKLYLPDDNHECLNADGPCMNWRYGKIEMRGTTIEDGFRNVKDEVKKYFPFVDSR